MVKLVLGIDEAGRGPALGAMVLAAVALDSIGARRLSRAAVADSKSFVGPGAGQARAALVAIIERTATWVGIDVCDVATVDAYAAEGKLNVLERERAERLLRRAPECARVIADGRTLFGPLCVRYPLLEARDRAEAAHVAVAAASLCAKVRRDELFACIAQRYQPLHGPLAGGGYVNDGTRAFTRRYVRAHGHLPPEARASWPWRGRARVRRVDA
jgi:ribonuclease HII